MKAALQWTVGVFAGGVVASAALWGVYRFVTRGRRA